MGKHGVDVGHWLVWKGSLTDTMMLSDSSPSPARTFTHHIHIVSNSSPSVPIRLQVQVQLDTHTFLTTLTQSYSSLWLPLSIADRALGCSVSKSAAHRLRPRSFATQFNGPAVEAVPVQRG